MSDFTVTRAYLADKINNKVGISYLESIEIIDVLFDEIINGVKNEEVVKISSFGSFYSRQKKQRIGRNPKTKEEAIIAPRKVVSFYVSNILKNKINSKK
ncbi:MAG: integration host factor subunit alpha [Alphaproteobacteria bacterium]